MNALTETPRKPKRRTHSREFKARLVALSRLSDASVASIAMEHGINANLLRRWIAGADSASLPNKPEFVQLTSAKPADPPASTGWIHVTVERNGTSVRLNWPASQADGLASWTAKVLA